jgi:hypothetical protein
MKPILRALLAVTVLAVPALAVSPSLRGIAPVGGQRGTEVTVTLSGARLTDAQEILFYEPGISVSKLEVTKEGSVLATLKISPEAKLGLHDFRVRTATGITGLKTFSVGVLKEVNEKEPNNDFKTPQPINMNVTVNGIADNEDIDYYSVKVKKGERITVEVEGIRLGLFLFDPYVAILNSKRFEISSSDDSALLWQDGFVSLVAPEDDTYIVAVRESAYKGNTQCLYRLHVGNFPRPTATMPAGGKIGETLSVRWIGDVLGEKTTKLTLPARFDRNFGLIATDERGSAPYPNAFRLSTFGNTIEAEPNDNAKTATSSAPPIALNGVIEKMGDVDYFRFSAKKGTTYDIRVFARQIRSPLDAILTIENSKGGRIARNDDTAGPDSYARFVSPKDDDYVLSITDHLKKGGPDYAYRVEIAPIEPKLSLSTPNESLRRGTGTMALAIPKGNRQSILINASRSDFRGDIAVLAANLPPGVRIEAENIKASNTQIPVLFIAEPTAKNSASLVQITGKPTDSSIQIPSEFTSVAELVLGQNNVPFWTRTVESLAVAVTDEAPFTLEIVEPKVPIVRGGTMNLKVVAHRKPGFTAPIAVSLPWNPPGTASKGSIVMPEGANEVTIPINASGGAELATWKIVVNGTYTEPPPPLPAGRTLTAAQQQARGRGNGAGRLTISSEFAKLTVAAQFLAMKFTPVSVEQGKTIDLPVKINKIADFPGQAEVKLIGLPNRATAEPVKITKDTEEIVFHVKTEELSPAGEAKNLFCEVVVMQNGEPIQHNLGTGRLRIDKPLPQKKGTTTAAKPVSGSKPLSRLEKLRLENKEKTKTMPVGLK